MKKIYATLALLALGMAIFYGKYQYSTNQKSELFLQNVAALAGDPDDEKDEGYGFVFCDGHNVICVATGNLKCCK